MRKAKKILKNINPKGLVLGKVIAAIPSTKESLIKRKLAAYLPKLRFIRNGSDTMILPSGVDKGLGIRLAMLYLNVDLDKTIVIGDGENDVDMFMNPGYKIALQNSIPKLKKLANEVIDKPSTEGIKNFIEMLKIEAKFFYSCYSF
jgi:HAD superfamily hydrolase (TIGR01484 family)